MAGEPFTHTRRDGSVLAWTGLSVCVCAKCDEIFASPAAFDMHLRRKGKRGAGIAKHDHSKMPRNAKGWKVTELHEKRHWE